ncbi:MAG: lytic transglycosylase [Marinomonas sp.]|jgi:membrane-bound lytic murein transglycosylase D|uniref:LysM peptidoglycan-binding domain-containing protein n=1 Tax=Marinomonas communis TaxID=28254 RepID=UPI001002A1E6|nr:LysM peptidoglycan-binding domain-containing protein [Marinomonas communis]MCC4275419.1 LysM peptidoglycan-binding domain-containing protein [Marinomonas communis]RUM48851.1 MAG: lytic transglycosylase [Marinomonas sp.]RUM52612.1 MAG: lytic transglycosylase [Marinomonas sp.]
MTKNILIALLAGTILTGCQSMTNQPADIAEIDAENEAIGAPEADANEVDFIDTVKPVRSDEAKALAKSKQDQEPANLPPEDLWDRIRAGYQFDLDVDQPRLKSQIRWYSTHLSYLDRVSKRGERYLHYIVEELEKEGLPLEIALLPIVESGFDPFGYSHGRASGPWQFIPSTGHMYGLEQTWWIDGRRDIQLSTKAAIAYLKRLNKMFDGDWLHALASYNSGEGTVMRAIRKNKKAGKPTDFWSLDLPAETRAYVPKLMALAIIMKNPERYNYETYFIANQPYFEEVNIGGQMDLAQAADMAEVSIDEIYLLNPAFNQWATSPDGPHTLLVPIDSADKFRTKLATLPPKERVTWIRYTVQAGDNLGAVARDHNTTVAVLQDINKISSNLIRVGQQLMIPVAGQSAANYTLSSHQRLLAKQSRSPSSSRVKVNYTVESGDSLWSIAKKYNTDTKTLARWNSMGLADPLFPGKKLVVWMKPETSSSKSSTRSVVKRVVYTIRSGDSLAVVANKFNVRVSDIRKWNPKVGSQKYVQPGDKVTLLVNVVGG